jgi:NACHT domain
VDVLRQIRAWADGDDKRYIFWLSGMAGTGKSTIARTVAHEYYEAEQLGASFFFSRGGGDTSHADKFFTSVAVQLAKRSPSLKRYICDAIAQHNDIASQTLHDQWSQLILRPLSRLEGNMHQPPLIIVVDALDECEGDDDIRGILELLASAESLQSIQFRIFITSRPEIPIRLGFGAMPVILHHDLVLHDISIFLKCRLGEIRDEYGLPADGLVIPPFIFLSREPVACLSTLQPYAGLLRGMSNGHHKICLNFLFLAMMPATHQTGKCVRSLTGPPCGS